jgi:hypothetical protein
MRYLAPKEHYVSEIHFSFKNLLFVFDKTKKTCQEYKFHTTSSLVDCYNNKKKNKSLRNWKHENTKKKRIFFLKKNWIHARFCFMFFNNLRNAWWIIEFIVKIIVKKKSNGLKIMKYWNVAQQNVILLSYVS